MAITEKRLGMGTLGTTEGTLYTSPAGTHAAVKGITITNKTAVDETFTIKFAGQEAVYQHTILANDVITIPFWEQILEPGETLQGQASEASAINYIVSGKERT